ncbi:MAG: glycosyltransferase family 2 protein [Crocinitomicaceae bacterium]|nr:glycosyltransferase family 2 protein [Crocinitomicaceae bacterium]
MISFDKSISVIIPVYNAAGYLKKAVESALAQNETGEVILVEDGSTDNSLEVCQKLADEHSQVKLYTHHGNANKGAGASRNIGLSKALFPLIAFLDSDDYFLPDRFSAEKKIFSTNPSADGVYNAIGIHYYDKEAQNFFQKTLAEFELTTVDTSLPPAELIYTLLGITRHGHFSLDGLTIKKKVLDDIALLFNEDLRLHQDTDFIIKLSYLARLFAGTIDVPVTNRGIHTSNRITAVPDNTIRLKNRSLMWQSLFIWAKKIEMKDDLAFSEIILQHYSHEITQRKGWKKWAVWISLLSSDKRVFFNDRYFRVYQSFLFKSGFSQKIIHKIKQLNGSERK